MKFAMNQSRLRNVEAGTKSKKRINCIILRCDYEIYPTRDTYRIKSFDGPFKDIFELDLVPDQHLFEFARSGLSLSSLQRTRDRLR